MPSEDLTEALTRLRPDAEGGLHESPHDRDSRETDEEAGRRYRLALDTCNGPLGRCYRQLPRALGQGQGGPPGQTSSSRLRHLEGKGAVSGWVDRGSRRPHLDKGAPLVDLPEIGASLPDTS